MKMNRMPVSQILLMRFKAHDPVDQAVIDLTSQEDSVSIAQRAYPDIDYSVQLEYGEKIGLGNRKYQLTETDF
ncbi:MAG: hypothetical protein WCS36_01815 [Candidatus Neomarinimicrobiota bacterium]|jgi:uncharacterized Fe-S center protein